MQIISTAWWSILVSSRPNCNIAIFAPSNNGYRQWLVKWILMNRFRIKSLVTVVFFASYLLTYFRRKEQCFNETSKLFLSQEHLDISSPPRLCPWQQSTKYQGLPVIMTSSTSLCPSRCKVKRPHAKRPQRMRQNPPDLARTT